MNLNDKINDIFNIILDIKTEDPGAATLLAEGLGLAINLIEAVVNKQDKAEIDLSEQVEIVSSVLGFSLPDMVKFIIAKQQEDSMNPNKQVDQETLDFITSDLDDYEKFLAQNKAKDDLDFLSKSI